MPPETVLSQGGAPTTIHFSEDSDRYAELKTGSKLFGVEKDPGKI